MTTDFCHLASHKFQCLTKTVIWFVLVKRKKSFICKKPLPYLQICFIVNKALEIMENQCVLFEGKYVFIDIKPPAYLPICFTVNKALEIMENYCVLLEEKNVFNDKKPLAYWKISHRNPKNLNGTWQKVVITQKSD